MGPSCSGRTRRRLRHETSGRALPSVRLRHQRARFGYHPGTAMSTAAPTASRKGLSLTQQIFIGLGIGILIGLYLHESHPDWIAYFKPFSTIFLNLIKMIIAPLIFATLVAGIAGAGHFKDVGRMGLRALIYFEVVTTIALLVGLLAVNILKPGVGVALATTKSDVSAASQSWDQILVHTIPTSV